MINKDISKEVKAVLAETKLFSHLSSADLDEVSMQCTYESYQNGDFLIKEGETGDRLFIILLGSVLVFTLDMQGQKIVLARLDEGQYFGEQALLPIAPINRNASVIAISDVKVLTLSHQAFQKWIAVNSELTYLLKEYGHTQLINKLIKQLESQEADQSLLLSLFVDMKSYAQREVFFRQNDLSTCAYYLLSGLVEIRFYDDKYRIKHRSIIEPGNFFGELGVLENKPRSGTAIALCDSSVAKIDASLLHDAYQKNINLKSLLQARLSLYQIPSMGLVTQYHSSFLDKPAITSTIQKPNGDVLVSSLVINADIFTIYYKNRKEFRTFNFKNEEDQVKIILLDDKNTLIGLTLIGQWPDTIELCQHVLDNIVIAENMLADFLQTGNLANRIERKREDIICECMQVKYEAIFKLISEGITTFEDIANKTGAGTVCGGCKPHILDLLGVKVWTYVKITEVRHHSLLVRSYQFKPLNDSVLPSEAGQHIVVEANIGDRWVARSYTLTSSSDENYYEITVKKGDKGLFSQWLFNSAAIGMTLRVSLPQGTFFLPATNQHPVLCFMAGIGITPAIAILKKITHNKQSPPLYIDYSIHDEHDLIFHDEFLNWSKDYPDITVVIRCTSKSGRINEQDIIKAMEKYKNSEIFICGPRSYEEMITHFLKRMSVANDKIHIERFINAGGPVT